MRAMDTALACKKVVLCNPCLFSIPKAMYTAYFDSETQQPYRRCRDLATLHEKEVFFASLAAYCKTTQISVNEITELTNCVIIMSYWFTSSTQHDGRILS